METVNRIYHKPKIVHLSLSDSGGAGTAAYRLHRGLLAAGLDSQMIVGHRKRNDPTIHIASQRSALDGKLNMSNSRPGDDLVKSSYARWRDNMTAYPLRPDGLEAFTDLSSGVRLSDIPAFQQADIIHFHWISGLVDLPRTLSNLKGKPVVWTLHDLNPFTGGCHYSAGCLKYRRQCGACPSLGSSREEDLSRSIWRQRAALYSQVNLNIVCPSEWLAGEARSSALLGSHPVRKICNGHPLDVFRPLDGRAFRKRHGISQDDTIILFCADAVGNLRKGFGLLRKSLAYLSEKSPSDKQVVLVTMGRNPVEFPAHRNLRILNLGALSDEKQIATVISAADVFVIPSLEDNLPNTVIETLGCGTPVVGFNVGGIPEMVQHMKTGYIAQPFDIKDFAQGMLWSLEKVRSDPYIPQRCRNVAEYNYDQRKQAETYTDLYKEILSQNVIGSRDSQFVTKTKSPETAKNYCVTKTDRYKKSFFRGEFERIYHYHIRKTGGTSINFAFFRLSGYEPGEIYRHINRQHSVTTETLRYVGWNKKLITTGNFDYGFSHSTFHDLNVPRHTFTFCILRDPIERLLSHYKMLVSMRESGSKHPGYIREAPWIEGGLDGFIERIDRKERLGQLYMFSKHFNVSEAIENIHSLSHIMILDAQFNNDLEQLQTKTKINLNYSHERKSKNSIQLKEYQKNRLHEVLEPEYLFFKEMLKALRKKDPAGSKHADVLEIKPGKHKKNSSNTIENAYNKLWNSKLKDSHWLQNDGKGRIEYACKILSDKILPEHKILDIGCGRGTLGMWLHRKKGMFGIDISPDAAAMAKKVYEEAHALNIDTEQLPYPDNCFDFVTYLDVIEHVFDPRFGLNEIERVLKPGGILILSTPNILAYVDKIKETRRFVKTSGDPEPYDGGHIHFFTYKDISMLLESSGYVDIQTVSPLAGRQDYEFKDHMVWVSGRKRDVQEGYDLQGVKFAENHQPTRLHVVRTKDWSFPVALVAYNRPDHTRKVIEALKECRPRKLYLFSDGPKKPDDAENVGKVRELFRSIDWTPHEIIERTENFGLARSVITAANHVFAQHDRMLLLEDDIVPFPSLFPFLEKALNKYCDNERVAGISGYAVPQQQEIKQNYCYDAYFFPRISSWGWATWKRVWNRFEPNLPLLVNMAMQKEIDITIGGSDLFRNLKHAIQGRDIWTMNWILRTMLDGAVFLYPLESQVKNIGMDGSGIHCGRTDKFEVETPVRPIELLPDSVFLDPDLIRTFYSFYDLEGTIRNLDVDFIGPYPVRKNVSKETCMV